MFFYAEINLINWSSLISFLLGIVTGMTLLIAILGILTARGKRQTKKFSGPTVKDISQDKIRELILSKQNAFIIQVEENDQDYLKATLDLSLELLHEISSYYYPDSKYPEYELTIDEAGELIHYIVDQILEIFDKPILKNFKNIKISYIASTIDKTRKVANNKAVKAVKDSGANEAYSTFRAITNTLNPVYWFRRVVVKGTINYTLKKVCKAGISIVGNESNKVYSKNLFKDDTVTETMNKDIEEIYSDEDEDK